MAFDAHKNLAYSLVATAPAPAASGTSLVVTAGQGTRFPAVPFNAVICAINELPVPSNAEIVRVTNIATDTLTIVRAQEGTAARTVLVGDQIFAAITAKTLTDIETAFAGTNGAITGGSITVNSSGVSVNLPAYLTTADLSQNSSKYAGTNGAITGGSITVNTSGVSVNLPAYLTTAMQSNAATISNIKISAGAASANLSAVTFSNSNGLAFGLNGSTITGSYTVPTVTAGSDTIGISNLGNTSGTSGVVSGDGIRYLLAGGNNITLSQSVNGVSATVTISAFNQSAQSAIRGFGASNTGNTSGNTGISTGIDWVLAGTNNITISESTAGGGPNTLWISGPTAGGGFQSAGFSTQGNTSGDTGFASQSLRLVGGNNITLSGSTGAGGLTLTISGANAGGAQTGISGLIVSDATYTSGTVSFSAQANITIGSSVNGVSQYVRLSVGAQTAQSAIEGFGVSNTGATAGNTGISTGVDWVLAGSQSITLSQSTAANVNTVWIQHPAWITTAMQSNAVTLSNIKVSAGTSSTNLSALTFADSNGISFGLNGSTITGSANTVGTATTVQSASSANSVGTVSRWAAEDHAHAGPVGYSVWRQMDNLVTIAQQSNSIVSIQPILLPRLVMSQAMVAASFSLAGTAANASSAYMDVSASLVLYSRNVSTLSSVASFHNGGVTQTFSSNVTGSVTGVIGFTMTGAAVTLSDGEYYAALHFSTNSTVTAGAATTSFAQSASMVLSQSILSALDLVKMFGAQTAASQGLIPGMGALSTNATRATLAISDYTMTGTRPPNAAFGFEFRNVSWW